MKPKLIFLTLALLLALLLPGCKTAESAQDILSHEVTAQKLSLEFERGGVSYRATLSFEADAEGGGWTNRLRFSSPESLSGLCFTDGERLTARLGDDGPIAEGDFPLPRAVLDCFSLLERHESGALTFVSCERDEAGVRLAVFSDGETLYEVRHGEGSDVIPISVTRRASNGETLVINLTS